MNSLLIELRMSQDVLHPIDPSAQRDNAETDPCTLSDYVHALASVGGIPHSLSSLSAEESILMVFDEQNGLLPPSHSEHRNGMRMACSSINRRKI